MAQLPKAPVTRLVRNVGAERVSKEASTALVGILEAEGGKIAMKAVSIAKHAGRKTVKREDILKAVSIAKHAGRKTVKREDILKALPGPLWPHNKKRKPYNKKRKPYNKKRRKTSWK
jgi:histone H3/H4